jgi:hypothetical protein
MSGGGRIKPSHLKSHIKRHNRKRLPKIDAWFLLVTTHHQSGFEALDRSIELAFEIKDPLRTNTFLPLRIRHRLVDKLKHVLHDDSIILDFNCATPVQTIGRRHRFAKVLRNARKNYCPAQLPSATPAATRQLQTPADTLA